MRLVIEMRIVIDLQGAQGVSRNRGIGHYSLQFAKALVRNNKSHEIIIVLNGAFADTIEPIRAAFAGLLPQERILVWDAPGHLAAIDPTNKARRHVYEKVRETFLASLQPDWVLVTSLFEGFVDDVVTSIERHMALPTAVVLYDLIPLIYSEHYFKSLQPAMEPWYLGKIDHLRRADLLLSISESSGREAIDYLDFEPDSVVHIGTDCDAQFRPVNLSKAQRLHLEKTYGIRRPFVMYTGGMDFRKNIEGLIRAYALLPHNVRSNHQLVVVCDIHPAERIRLLELSCEVGLAKEQLVITGLVPYEDLLLLYNACALLVFPSWREEFGMSVLEAMRCGKAVLAANISSLPEIVGNGDALFDPFDGQDMAALIERVLTDNAFRLELERHSLKQSQRFSWDRAARRALKALKKKDEERKIKQTCQNVNNKSCRLKLAYVSPLPPEKTGIADYSAELIQDLTRWYEVDVVVAQEQVSDIYIIANCRIRSIEEFRSDTQSYDRVLYHFGNSTFHEHMFGLLEKIPGVVVLHDFFLSGVLAHLEMSGQKPGVWTQSLMESHGYSAIRERFAPEYTEENVIWRYPANLPVLQHAQGVIAHSEFSKQLAKQWYGEKSVKEWAVIPLLKKSVTKVHRKTARQVLGFDEDAILICSFGMLGPTKLNHRVLEAWLGSSLSSDSKVHLVFVGENDAGEYGHQILQKINSSKLSDRTHITGWVDNETYRHYLAAADIGVQLRSKSRGETSAAVLDCMNYGLATIINANDSNSEIDPSCVWMLPDEFSDEELVEALTVLAENPTRRRVLGARAREVVHRKHSPRRCAEQYYHAIERFYMNMNGSARLNELLQAISKEPLAKAEWPRLATSLVRNFPPLPRRRQLLVDVSVLVQQDYKTGIQRVVRSILREWLYNPPEGFQVEPIYAASDQQGYRYARRWTSRFLNVPDDWGEDLPVEAWAGDVFIGLDLHHHVVSRQKNFLLSWRNRGVKIWFVVYDLLPILLPHTFVDGMQRMHSDWLRLISQYDGVVCISQAVADEMIEWLKSFRPKRFRPLAINWFHLGADIESSAPTQGLPEDADQILPNLFRCPSFLMVGTVEPRKGHAQTLEAFEQLWSEGVDCNLVIVGKQGWNVDTLVKKLRKHPELGRRLFWLEAISDEYLEKVYAASACLIAASYGEGFGLPLIEAAQHKLPIIARDISVFREVAGRHAYYFDDSRDPGVIADAVKTWLKLHRAGKAPSSDKMSWLTWKQSAQQLLEAILEKGEPYKTWPSVDDVIAG